MSTQYSTDPGKDKADELISSALRLHHAGLLSEAARLYEQILAEFPRHYDAHYLLGLACAAGGDAHKAIAHLKAAIEITPESPLAHYNLGLILQGAGEPDSAIDHFRHAVRINPAFPEAHNNLGNMLSGRGLMEDAARCYEQALALRPDYAEALNNLGNVFRAKEGYENALQCFRKALSINPSFADALTNLGGLLVVLKRPGEALEAFLQAEALNPGNADVLNAIGNLLAEQKRFPEAIACYRQSLEIAPDNADTHLNIGIALRDNGESGAGADHLKKALEIRPAHADAMGWLLRVTMEKCDFREFTALRRRLAEQFTASGFAIDPFIFIGINNSPADELTCSTRFAQRTIPNFEPLCNGANYAGKKIRIAYLSADFHEHATAYLMAELFEIHDREKFEVIGVSFGPDDGSSMRRRLVNAFDTFLDVRADSDLHVARRLRELQVDIAVDLKGYTANERIGILARRPAPVQVSYLGYPGTTGTRFLDYVIGDRFVTPFEQQAYFTEKIVQLPDAYQVNDTRRAISPVVPTRKDCGLPESGFVFCCFNNSAKILPDTFDAWMRILRAVDGSVLWLIGENNNLRAEASARGIAPERLIFAQRRTLEHHLARHRAADLFLDTLPYNAHTTASDALWAGLPVLTCMGNTFAGRVAASLLNAAGLPELITHSMDEYAALAIRLATEPAALRALRERLALNRTSCPLFDTNRFRLHIEKAFELMVERHRRGEPPLQFAVAAQ